jgi:cysteine synthase
VDKTTEPAMGEMRYYNNVLEAIGSTPLVCLNRIASDVPPLVLAKMEMLNPGGSVKDRIGPAMIEYCEKLGVLRQSRQRLKATTAFLS